MTVLTFDLYVFMTMRRADWKGRTLNDNYGSVLHGHVIWSLSLVQFGVGHSIGFEHVMSSWSRYGHRGHVTVFE